MNTTLMIAIIVLVVLIALLIVQQTKFKALKNETKKNMADLAEKEELLQKSEERGYVSPGYIVYIAQKHNTSLSTINKYCDEENIKIKE